MRSLLSAALIGLLLVVVSIPGGHGLLVDSPWNGDDPLFSSGLIDNPTLPFLTGLSNLVSGSSQTSDSDAPWDSLEQSAQSSTPTLIYIDDSSLLSTTTCDAPSDGTDTPLSQLCDENDSDNSDNDDDSEDDSEDETTYDSDDAPFSDDDSPAGSSSSYSSEESSTDSSTGDSSTSSSSSDSDAPLSSASDSPYSESSSSASTDDYDDDDDDDTDEDTGDDSSSSDSDAPLDTDDPDAPATSSVSSSSGDSSSDDDEEEDDDTDNSSSDADAPLDTDDPDAPATSSVSSSSGDSSSDDDDDEEEEDDDDDDSSSDADAPLDTDDPDAPATSDVSSSSGDSSDSDSSDSDSSGDDNDDDSIESEDDTSYPPSVGGAVNDKCSIGLYGDDCDPIQCQFGTCSYGVCWGSQGDGHCDAGTCTDSYYGEDCSLLGLIVASSEVTITLLDNGIQLSESAQTLAFVASTSDSVPLTAWKFVDGPVSTVTGLHPGTCYVMRARYDGVWSSNVDFCLSPSRPLAPSLSLSSLDDGSTVLSFVAPAMVAATYYEFIIYEGAYAIERSKWQSTPEWSTTSVSLRTGTSYEVKVFILTAAGTSQPSPGLVFTIEELVYPQARSMSGAGILHPALGLLSILAGLSVLLLW